MRLRGTGISIEKIADQMRIGVGTEAVPQCPSASEERRLGSLVRS